MKISGVVNVSDWEFSFGGSEPRLAGTELYRAPEIVNFATPLELLLHLAEDSANDNLLKNEIQRRLKADPVAKAWHKKRGTIGSMVQFGKYRKNGKYDVYHAAAASVAARTATKEQEVMVLGLDQEIAASEVIIPNGQVLFHGRADRALHASLSYPSFISTSLDPTVSIWHALKRQLDKELQAKAVIYLLTVREPLRAIWGNGGSLSEWEVLLQTRLRCTWVSSHEGTRFDIVNATIGERDSSEIETGAESL